MADQVVAEASGGQARVVLELTPTGTVPGPGGPDDPDEYEVGTVTGIRLEIDAGMPGSVIAWVGYSDRPNRRVLSYATAPVRAIGANTRVLRRACSVPYGPGSLLDRCVFSLRWMGPGTTAAVTADATLLVLPVADGRAWQG